MFEIKDGYELELQMPEIIKLFDSTKKLIDKTKNGEKVPSFEVVEVVLVQYNLVDNQYKKKSEVLYTFTPNKCYAYLLNVEPSHLSARKYKKQLLDTGLDASKKLGHKGGEYLGNKIADVITKSNDDNIEKQEPVEEIILPPGKREDILNNLRKVL